MGARTLLFSGGTVWTGDGDSDAVLVVDGTVLVLAVMPPQSDDVRVAGLGTAADYLLARGITWVQDAWVEPAYVATYLAAAERDELRMRFNLALYADPRHFDTQIAGFAESVRSVADRGHPLLTQ